MTLIVSKFGGSSVGDAERIARCVRLFLHNPHRKLAVISATQHTTNQLEEVAHLAESSAEYSGEKFLDLMKRHHQYATYLGIQSEFLPVFNLLKDEGLHLISCFNNEKKSPLFDQLLSLGERLSSSLFFHYLKKISPNQNCELLDARDFIKTDEHFGNANVLFDETNRLINTLALKKNMSFVTQGFIASSLKGESTILGREGSDYSAAIFAGGINATMLEIWTDVDGIYICDPKTFETSSKFKEISYECASKMAFWGSKVLFEKTMNPLVGLDIPIYVASSFNPEVVGTWIKEHSNEFMPNSMAHKENIVHLKVFPKDGLDQAKIISNLTLAVEGKNIFQCHFVESQNCYNVIFEKNSNAPLGEIDRIIEKIKEFSSVDIFSESMIISVFGDRIYSLKEKLKDYEKSLISDCISFESLVTPDNQVSVVFHKRWKQRLLKDFFFLMEENLPYHIEQYPDHSQKLQ